MAAKPDFPQQFAAIQNLLACPACHGELRLAADPPQLLCAHCGNSYAVVDGIPMLISPQDEKQA